MTFWQLLNTGGATVYVLLSLSVFSLAVIIERLVFYTQCSRVGREALINIVKDELKKIVPHKAVEVCRVVNTPCARVAEAGLIRKGMPTEDLESAMDRQITIELTRLEKRTSIVGTIGSTAVYIGLFGTVLGIIKAFQDIAEKGTGGVSVVINGVSEALICTAIGLCVAIPAVAAYNYFIKRIEDLVRDMEVTASEIVELVKPRP